MTPAQKQAWIAYYTALRDSPDSTPEERKRGADMLAKGERIGIHDLSDINAEDLA